MMKRRNNKRREKPVAKNCQFCQLHTEPDYKDTGTLNKYLTERAKVIGRARTGVCAKHQRAITIAVKRARYIALLPFVIRA